MSICWSKIDYCDTIRKWNVCVCVCEIQSLGQAEGSTGYKSLMSSVQEAVIV